MFRGNKEADIRKNLIRCGFVKGVIGLPANLFYGTGIPACILIIDKEYARARTGIFMVDASKGFLKEGPKNRLRAQDIHKIVDVFNKQIELPGYSRMVPVSEIANAANDYNLNIPRYIDSSEPEDLHDLSGHLYGGIPDRDIDSLEAYWHVFPSLRQTLFTGNGRPGYSEARIEAGQIKNTILAHEEFRKYRGRITAVFDDWREKHEPFLKELAPGDNPRDVIYELSEDLLARFSDLPLLDRYNVYQRLMNYWDEAMQDDVYLIVTEGWADAARPRGIIHEKKKKIKETPDLTVKGAKYKMDLIPPELIVARYFAGEQTEIEGLRARQEAAARKLEEFVEEYTGEEGLLEDVVNDKGKITKTSVAARLKALRYEPEGDEERTVLQRCRDLMAVEAKATKSVKSAQSVLDEQALARYGVLAEAEIKAVVVEDKWFADIRAAIEGEVERLTQRLAGRVQELEERYARPLPELEQDVEAYSAKVEEHLKRMGVLL